MTDFKNKLVIPLRFARHMGEVIPDPNCPQDQLCMVDDDGHVHLFKYLGRLIDICPAEPDDEQSDVLDWSEWGSKGRESS